MAMVRNYTPTIVFSFSKKECEENAKNISKLDFSNDDEKKMIAQIFSNAIDSLSDDDKKLPQVSKYPEFAIV
jgi:ATP-dependent RNA helicase DOB1